MGLRDKITGVGKFAWGHKGVLLKGAQLHPGVALVLKMKDLKPGDVVKVAGELAAADIERLLGEHDHDARGAVVESIKPILKDIVAKTDVSNEDVAEVLSALSDEFRGR